MSAEEVWVVMAHIGGYDESIDSIWTSEAGARQRIVTLKTEGYDGDAVPYPLAFASPWWRRWWGRPRISSTTGTASAATRLEA